MKMQLGCDCCGPGKCSKAYHVNPGRQLWIGGNDTPISVSPASPDSTTSVVFDPDPSTWNPDDREPDKLLGGWAVYGVDPQNYYNVNPNYYGHPHFDFPDFTKVDYSHPTKRRGGQFTSNDLMFQSGTDVPMFGSYPGNAQYQPNCNLWRQFTNTEYTNDLIGSDQVPASITRTFPKVPLDFDRDLSFIVDGKTVHDTYVDYWCSDAGSGQAISLFDVGTDPYVVLDYYLPSGYWYPGVCKRIGFDFDGAISWDNSFVLGVEMDGIKETQMSFDFSNGDLRLVYADGGYDWRGMVHGMYISGHVVISTTPVETIPHHSPLNAAGWYQNGGPNPDYGTIFLHRVTRAFYDHHGATTCDGFFMGKPLPMIKTPWDERNEPTLLGDVTIQFDFTFRGSFPTKWPGISGANDTVTSTGTESHLRTTATEWKDPAFETSLDLPCDGQPMTLQTYDANDVSSSISNPRYPGGPFWTRGFITNQTSATISPDPMILRRHN